MDALWCRFAVVESPKARSRRGGAFGAFRVYRRSGSTSRPLAALFWLLATAPTWVGCDTAPAPYPDAGWLDETAALHAEADAYFTVRDQWSIRRTAPAPSSVVPIEVASSDQRPPQPPSRDTAGHEVPWAVADGGSTDDAATLETLPPAVDDLATGESLPASDTASSDATEATQASAIDLPALTLSAATTTPPTAGEELPNAALAGVGERSIVVRPDANSGPATSAEPQRFAARITGLASVREEVAAPASSVHGAIENPFFSAGSGSPDLATAAADPQQWIQHLDAALSHAQRGDVTNARQLYRQSLAEMARCADVPTGEGLHVAALSRAFTALDEADELDRHADAIVASDELQRVASGFGTPVDLSDIATVADAADAYRKYAQVQFALALNGEPIAADVLLLLAKVPASLPAGGLPADGSSWQRSVSLLQAALLVKSDHHVAANELGVLYASRGDLQTACEMFARSITSRASAEAAHNLALLGQRLAKQQPPAATAARPTWRSR